MDPREVVRIVAPVEGRATPADGGHPGGQGVHEVAVVGDEHDRALVVRQGVQQRPLGVEIEVVGRLVEKEKIRRAQEKTGQRQPASFAAGEDRGLLLHGLSRKQERPQDVADLGEHGERRRVGHGLAHRPGGIEIVPVRAVVGDPDVVAKFPTPGVQAFLTGDQPDEGGFPGAVRSHEREALAALHDEVHVAEDLVGSEGLGNRAERYEDPPGTRRMRQAQGHPPGLRRHFDPLDLLERADPALDLPRAAGLVPEPVDEAFGPFDLGRLLGGPLAQVGDLGGPLGFVAAVGARVVAEAAQPDLGDPGHHGVEEVPVVGDQHETPAVTGEEAEQPRSGFDVQIVRGLVEEDEVVRLDQQPGEGDAHLPALAEGLRGTVLVPGRESQAGEDLADAGVHFVPAAALPLLFQFAVAGDEFGLIRGPGELFGHVLLFAPQPEQVGEGGAHLLGDGAALESEPLLGQVSDALPPGQHDLSGVGGNQSREDLQEGGLAGPVGPDQTDAIAVANLPRHLTEQDLFPVRLRGLDELDHGGGTVSRGRTASRRSGPGPQTLPPRPAGATLVIMSSP